MAWILHAAAVLESADLFTSRMRHLLRALAVAIVLAFVATSAHVDAAIYAGWGTLAFNRPGPDFSLCFAGDSAETRPDRALKVLDHVRHIEWAANIRFHPPGKKSIRIQSGAPLRATDWRCPANERTFGALPQGDLGDIRVLLNTPANAPWWRLATVGGDGCAIDNRPSNWGVIGNEPVLSRWCDFNLKLGDSAPAGTTDYYLNLTLHEFGHRLGFEHEHDRTDAPCFKGGMADGGTVKMADARGTVVTSDPMRFLTRFDRLSVMMYRLAECNSQGSVGDSGFSDLDRLALRILYPEDLRVAEISGVRVVRAGTPVELGNLWKSLGAIVNTTPTSVAGRFAWTVDGVARGTTPDARLILGEGRHQVLYSYLDFLGRAYVSETEVEVVSPRQFDRRMAAQTAIAGAVLH
jgi:hypothetical protein